MSERYVQSLAILLAGLFSAEQPAPPAPGSRLAPVSRLPKTDEPDADRDLLLLKN